MPDYSEFLHEYGYGTGSRQYKMFQFSQLNGDYYVDQKHRKIVFRSYVTFEVRSPEPLLINLLAMSFQYQGVTFGTMNCRDIHLELYDYTVEETELHIRMKTPLTVYSTDYDTKRTYFYSPEEPEFYQKLDYTSQPFTGTGTEEDPYVFLVSSAKGKVTVMGSFFNRMAGMQ